MFTTLHDQLIAAVAAFGVLLSTGGILHQRALDTANQVRLNSAHVSLESFTEVLEQDLRSIGSGVAAGSPMIHAFDSDALSFSGTADSSAAARTVTYARTTAPAGPNGEFRYVVTRSVDGVVTAQSPALTDATVALLAADGTPVSPAALDNTRRVEVHLEMEPPFSEMPGAEIDRVVWGTEVAPPNLARRQSTSESHPLLSANVSLTQYGS